MTPLFVFFICALLLSVERLSYLVVWRFPAHFQRACRHPLPARLGEPLDVLKSLFQIFKVLQVGVFWSWCAWFAGTPVPVPPFAPLPDALGGFLIFLGMCLNFSVFSTLGKTGVFYGNRLGYDVPWHDGFPFSLVPHPQYLGAVLAIWGFFLFMRFPHPDWVALPLLETIYYALGARLEQ